MSFGQLLHEQSKVFWRPRGCMHPLASSATCSGKVIDAHSIQRKGPLARIVDDTNHVYHFEHKREEPIFEVERIGWNKASVFPGYCAGHDATLFRDLEGSVFKGHHQHCVLQSFRSVCNELYKKQALVESLEMQRDLIDQGCEFEDQVTLQLSYHGNIKGQLKSLQELQTIWSRFESAVTDNQFDHFRSKVYFFNGDICISSSGAVSAEFDFEGTKLADMWDLSVDLQSLSHSIMDTEQGGAIVFVWHAEEEEAARIVATFDAIDPDQKGDIFVQYCFLNCENTYFAKAWWDRLNSAQRAQVHKYARSLFYEGGKFVANRNRLVDWSFE